MKVKITKSLTVDGSKVKKGDILELNPKIATKIIVRGYATSELAQEPISYAPDQPFQDAEDVDKSIK